MIKQFFVLLLLIINGIGQAAISPKIELLKLSVDVHNKERLQRGAKLFMNYCSGCHSLQYMRYNRMAKDIGLTTFDGEADPNLLYNNLIFTKAKVHDPIRISLPKSDAREWFGVLPPDLSLVARRRGSSWLYTYLKSFYIDKNRPFGTNNLIVPDTAMPNVLESLSGIFKVKKNLSGDGFSHIELVTKKWTKSFTALSNCKSVISPGVTNSI